MRTLLKTASAALRMPYKSSEPRIAPKSRARRERLLRRIQRAEAQRSGRTPDRGPKDPIAP